MALKTTRLLGVALALALVACAKIKSSDLVGTWTNPDGGNLRLNSDGTFSARGLPAQVFMTPFAMEGPINGAGRWSFEGHNLLWRGDRGQLSLLLEDAPGYPPRVGVEIIIADRNTLFQWKGEEGGERYELKKRIR